MSVFSDKYSGIFKKTAPSRSAGTSQDGRTNGLGDGMEDDFGGGFSDGFSDGFDDGFDDGFSDGFDDGFDDGFGRNGRINTDDSGRKAPDGFNDDFSDGFDDDFGGDLKSKDVRPSSPADGKHRQLGADDLAESLRALFMAVTERIGRIGKKRKAGIDSADSSFAGQFDASLDDGIVNKPPPEVLFFDDSAVQRENAPQSAPEDSGIRGGEESPAADGSLSGPFPDRDFYRRRQSFGGSPDVYGPSPSVRDEMPSAGDQERDGYSDDSLFKESEEEENADSPRKEREIPDGFPGKVILLWRNFCGRLPSFRPKVYVLPQSDYDPDQDGIRKPTLASDIRRILDEQSRLGDTETEYDRMRSYINSVSTDTRLRPGDISPPENIGEVRAAEDELYDMIDMISSANEEQRSRIGVYAQPQEEDPYNFRGINDDRQFYADMEAYSFDMDSAYGFESEKKIDPQRIFIQPEHGRFSAGNSGMSGEDRTQGGRRRFNASGSQHQQTGGFRDGSDSVPDGRRTGGGQEGRRFRQTRRESGRKNVDDR